MDGQQIILNIFGALVLAILGWALHSLIGSVGKQIDGIGKRIDDLNSSLNKRIDDVGGALNKRIDDLRSDFTGRFTEVETRLTAIDGSLAAIQKELVTRGHGPAPAPEGA